MFDDTYLTDQTLFGVKEGDCTSSVSKHNKKDSNRRLIIVVRLSFRGSLVMKLCSEASDKSIVGHIDFS